MGARGAAYEISHRKVRVTLGFVFSHVGGCVGNDYVDKLATRMCAANGREWVGAAPLWHTDTTRRIHNRRHEEVDLAAQHGEKVPFRFRHIPTAFAGRPSAPLPRDMPRHLERLVFQGRTGMVVKAGGTLPTCNDICRSAASLTRLGATVRRWSTLRHACANASRVSRSPSPTADLWNDPTAAAHALDAVSGLAKQLRPIVAAPQHRARHVRA